MSAIALVRVKRGSTWITVAPRSLRLHHPLEADRVALGHVRAHDHDAVGVRPGPAGTWWPRRARTRSPDRGRWSCVICGPGSRSGTTPSAVNSFLIGSSPRCRASRRRGCAMPSVRLQPCRPSSSRSSQVASRVAITRSAIISIASSSGELLPLGAVRAPVLDLVLAQRAGDELLEAAPFGQRRPREIGRVAGSPSIWVTSRVLHVDELPAADRAVRADGLHDSLCRPGPWVQAGASPRTALPVRGRVDLL